MRKRKTVFIDSLVSLLICFGVSLLINHSDKESQWLLAGCLLYVCVIAILPVALSNLRTKNHYHGGLYLVLMLFPLLLALSHPDLSLTDFNIVISKISILADIRPIIINFFFNSLIFFAAGNLFVSINSRYVSDWKGATLTTFLLLSLYVFLFFFLYIQPAV